MDDRSIPGFPVLNDAEPGAIREFDAHGISPLLYQLNRNCNDNPKTLQTLEKIANRWEATNLLRLENLIQLIEKVESRQIPLLLLKGFPLAHQVYPFPGLRPCMDIDLLIRSEDTDVFKDILSGLGYSVSSCDSESLISFQFIASLNTDLGLTMVLDVHRKINNQQKYSRLFSFKALYERSVAIPQIHEHARGLCFPDAILLACIHRLGHLSEVEPIRLIWLYDIHLMVEHLDNEEQDQLVRLTESMSLESECASGILAAQSKFETRIPKGIQQLVESGRSGVDKLENAVSSDFTKGWQQFRYQPDWRSRCFLLKQVLFPAKDYMREKYPDSNSWLPLLYGWRLYSGIKTRVIRDREVRK